MPAGCRRGRFVKPPGILSTVWYQQCRYGRKCKCRKVGLMMKKESYSSGLEASLSLIGGKWKFLILWHLSTGKKRFGELRRLVGGVSEKVLIQDLKEFVGDGLVKRIDHQEVPQKWSTS